MAKSINYIMKETYWEISKYIVGYEQSGNTKSTYGKSLLTELLKELTLRLGKGFSRPNLNNMWKLYLQYPICELVKIDDELERSFYEKQSVLENWSLRTLKRQIDSALFFGYKLV